MKFTFNDPVIKENRQKLRSNMTEPERRLWYHLRNRQFHKIKFRRQYSIWSYILDFYAPEIKIGLEIDGDSHAESIPYDTKCVGSNIWLKSDLKCIIF